MALQLAVEGVGQIEVALDTAAAPQTAQTLLQLAAAGATAELHRAEPLPPAGSDGPPYALVQFTVDDAAKLLAGLSHEGSAVIMRGSVCLIGGTSDVFISLAAHPGWEASMTVVGRVSEAQLEQQIGQILRLPRHNFTHPTYGTVMSMLDKKLPMRLASLP